MLATHPTTTVADTSRTATGTDPIWPALAQLREESGESIASLADRLDVTPAALASWLRGDRQPTVAQTTLVAAALGVRLGLIPAGHTVVPTDPDGDTDSWATFSVSWADGLCGVNRLPEAEARSMARQLDGAQLRRHVHSVTTQDVTA